MIVRPVRKSNVETSKKQNTPAIKVSQSKLKILKGAEEEKGLKAHMMAAI